MARDRFECRWERCITESGRFLEPQQAMLVLRVDVNIICGQQHRHYHLLPEIEGLAVVDPRFKRRRQHLYVRTSLKNLKISMAVEKRIPAGQILQYYCESIGKMDRMSRAVFTS